MFRSELPDARARSTEEASGKTGLARDLGRQCARSAFDEALPDRRYVDDFNVI